MPDYFVTGKKGSGKSLCAVGRMKEYLDRGSPVVTNLDIWTEHLLGPKNKKCRITRIPDKPTAKDFHLIGRGNDTKDEEKNGGIFLDELGTWFNSRTWNDKNRQEVIDWLLHARKLGWDVFYLVQDISIVDKQAREALAEHVVYCRRVDRLNIPFLGAVYRFFVGSKLPLPRIHLAIVKYGDQQHSLKVDQWTYRGNGLFNAYDTQQVFRSDYPHGPHSYLPGWIVKGQFQIQWDRKNIMRITRIYLRRWSRVGAFGVGFFMNLVLLAGLFVWISDPAQPTIQRTVKKDLPGDLRELVQGAKISGYLSLPGKAPVYHFKTETGFLSSRDLIEKGFKVFPGGKNNVTLRWDDETFNLARF